MKNNDGYKKYRKTFNGMVYRMYEKMVGRCKHGYTTSPELYRNKFVPKFSSFKELAHRSRKLKRLYNVWKNSGFQLSLRPTPDRINSEIGYELGNIRFVTYSDNVKLGNKKRCKKERITT